jgi:hypothetical protein
MASVSIISELFGASGAAVVTFILCPLLTRY